MASETIKVEGLKECIRALRKVEDETEKTVKDALKKSVEPVTLSAREKIGRYRGASLKTIGPKVSVHGVSVVQRARKVTGKHPDFGRLQLRRGLEPALEENADRIRKDVDDAIGMLIRATGFE